MMIGKHMADRAARRDLDFAGFAQEFLRRNPAYREEYRAVSLSVSQQHSTLQLEVMAQRWGLCFPVPAGRRPG